MRDLNPRHSPCKGDALPTELITRVTERGAFYRLSGVCQQDVCIGLNKTPLVFCETHELTQSRSHNDQIPLAQRRCDIQAMAKSLE